MESVLLSEDYLRSIDIHGILPQREPFVMVDRLVAFSMDSSVTETIVRDTNIFVDDGVFTASGIMENMAQTCAARIGFYNKYILHNEVQVGFIGAVRDFIIHSLPLTGSLITTKVNIIEDVFGMTLAEASVMCDGKMIAEAEIKLSVKNIG